MANQQKLFWTGTNVNLYRHDKQLLKFYTRLGIFNKFSVRDVELAFMKHNIYRGKCERFRISIEADTDRRQNFLHFDRDNERYRFQSVDRKAGVLELYNVFQNSNMLVPYNLYSSDRCGLTKLSRMFKFTQSYKYLGPQSHEVLGIISDIGQFYGYGTMTVLPWFDSPERLFLMHFVCAAVSTDTFLTNIVIFVCSYL
jgi:hypothetical protein